MGLKVLWAVDIKYGYSNVVIQHGRLFTMGLYKDKLTFHCLQAKSGMEIGSSA